MCDASHRPAHSYSGNLRINKNLIILNMTPCKEIFCLLVMDGILNEKIASDIMARDTKKEINEALVDLILVKGEIAASKFSEALKFSGHLALANLLCDPEDDTDKNFNENGDSFKPKKECNNKISVEERKIFDKRLLEQNQPDKYTWELLGKLKEKDEEISELKEKLDETNEMVELLNLKFRDRGKLMDQLKLDHKTQMFSLLKYKENAEKSLGKVEKKLKIYDRKVEEIVSTVLKSFEQSENEEKQRESPLNDHKSFQNSIDKDKQTEVKCLLDPILKNNLQQETSKERTSGNNELILPETLKPTEKLERVINHLVKCKVDSDELKKQCDRFREERQLVVNYISTQLPQDASDFKDGDDSFENMFLDFIEKNDLATKYFKRENKNLSNRLILSERRLARINDDKRSVVTRICNLESLLKVRGNDAIKQDLERCFSKSGNAPIKKIPAKNSKERIACSVCSRIDKP